MSRLKVDAAVGDYGEDVNRGKRQRQAAKEPVQVEQPGRARPPAEQPGDEGKAQTTVAAPAPIASGGGMPAGGSTTAQQIAAWLADHFTATIVGGVTVYDLTASTETRRVQKPGRHAAAS
jgi:hypothetical protein